MEIFRKILMVLTVFTVLLSTPLLAAADFNTSTKVENYSESEVIIEPLNKNLIIDVLKRVLVNYLTGRTLANYPGAVVDHGNSFFVQHPNVRFNSNGIQHRVRKDLRVYGQDEIRAFMSRNSILNSSTKPVVEIYNGGRDPVVGYPVNTGQQVTYKIPGGYNTAYTNYYVVYGTTATDDWIPRMWYIRSSEPCVPCLPLSASDSLVYDKYVIVDDRVYIKQPNLNVNASSQASRDVLTLDELFFEFYDVNNKELTNQTKSLLPGETVNVIDTIQDLDYNANEGYTTFKFKSTYSENEYHNASFSGDITAEYQIGDQLELKFELVKQAEVDGQIFVELDYNLNVEKTGETPKIDSFIKE